MNFIVEMTNESSTLECECVMCIVAIGICVDMSVCSVGAEDAFNSFTIDVLPFLVGRIGITCYVCAVV